MTNFAILKLRSLLVENWRLRKIGSSVTLNKYRCSEEREVRFKTTKASLISSSLLLTEYGTVPVIFITCELWLCISINMCTGFLSLLADLEHRDEIRKGHVSTIKYYHLLYKSIPAKSQKNYIFTFLGEHDEPLTIFLFILFLSLSWRQCWGIQKTTLCLLSIDSGYKEQHPTALTFPIDSLYKVENIDTHVLILFDFITYID